MESSPPKRNAGHVGEDGISTLPDHLLLDILERLHLREAVRAGALSTRWRHLPSHLSLVHLDASHFRGATSLQVMDAFTDAARALLTRVPPAEGVCESGALKVLVLSFYTSSPHLSSIGRLIEDIVSLGQTQCLEFCISPLGISIEIGQEFMAFSRAYPVAFSWLTTLTLEYHAFGHSDITDLISTCSRLRHLSLRFYRLLDLHSTLKIDVPCSELQELEFIGLLCTRIELVSVPKLRQVECKCWLFNNPPVRFGYVPELRGLVLASKAKAWQEPFALSECLSTSVGARNLSTLTLCFGYQMIWIQPEPPKQLIAIFRNLTSVRLFGIFSECDLSWTLFILEAAPALHDLAVSLSRHSCAKPHKNSAEKTNVVWEPSKDLKHLNLEVLQIFGCEDEDKVTNYMRLVMERAVGLLKIQLYGESPCTYCDATSLERSKAEKASRHRIKEQLTHGSSSSVEIIIC
ncbi:F-box/FBD/LRR-repeat protein At5g22660 [Aegilops tauschii subsp. strangulata]|uniref:F-box/FBD/LRR-repeat protein At5g22660 n=1 Tax=Aegilops tauschii subsp. strangulata TaxID=200361 RepID=UPI00098A935E